MDKDRFYELVGLIGNFFYNMKTFLFHIIFTYNM